jgi:hypothetical protein
VKDSRHSWLEWDMADIQETGVQKLIEALARISEEYSQGWLRISHSRRCSALRDACQSDELVAKRTNMPDLSGTNGAKIPLSPVIDEIRQNSAEG